VVFLFPVSCCYNQQKQAKTGTKKQKSRKNPGKSPPQRWADTDVDPPPFVWFFTCWRKRIGHATLYPGKPGKHQHSPLSYLI